jgi:hypothetical protein
MSCEEEGPAGGRSAGAAVLEEVSVMAPIAPEMRTKLEPGMRLVARFKNVDHAGDVAAAADGKLRFRFADGSEFGSPSAAGSHVTGKASNGWMFWSLDGAEKVTPEAARVARGEAAAAAHDRLGESLAAVAPADDEDRSAEFPPTPDDPDSTEAFSADSDEARELEPQDEIPTSLEAADAAPVGTAKRPLCEFCGDAVAANWMARHVEARHPSQVSKPARGSRKTVARAKGK